MIASLEKKMAKKNPAGAGDFLPKDKQERKTLRTISTTNQEAKYEYE